MSYQQAHSHLLQVALSYPKIEFLINRNGVMKIEPEPGMTIAEYIAKTVAGQQLSTVAAATIWSRVKKLQNQHHLDFCEFVRETNEENLRSCGLSRSKVKCIKGVIAANLDGNSLSQLSEKDVRDQLIDLWGVGHWTVDMILLFYLQLPDIWSEPDAGLKRAINMLLPDDIFMQNSLIEACKPYRSYLSLHLWSGLDNNYFV